MTNGAHDELPIADPPQRVSGMRLPDDWHLPGKPADLDADEEDAWRQTGFTLGDDLRRLEENLRLQVALARTGYTPAARSMTMAGYASLWSRGLLATSDAAALTRRGAYTSASALVRQAVEMVGAQLSLPDELDEWRRFTHSAYGRHAPTRSTEIGVGHYFGGGAIAADPHLRVVYRVASDLSRPNFGPTALFAAADANHDRYPLVFADRAFHLGWAQLLLGWLLRTGITQLHAAMHLSVQFPAPAELRERVVAHVRDVEAALAAPGRCVADEIVDEDGRRRTVIAEFRRRDGDAPKRLLL